MESLIIALVLAHGAPVDWNDDCHENPFGQGNGWHYSHPPTEADKLQKRGRDLAEKAELFKDQYSYGKPRDWFVRETMARIGCPRS